MFIKGRYFQFGILLLSLNFVSWAYLFIHLFIQPFDKYAGTVLNLQGWVRGVFCNTAVSWTKGKIWDQGNTKAMLKRGAYFRCVDIRKWCVSWKDMSRGSTEFEWRQGCRKREQLQQRPRVGGSTEWLGLKGKNCVPWEQPRKGLYFHIKKFGFILKSWVSLTARGHGMLRLVKKITLAKLWRVHWIIK